MPEAAKEAGGGEMIGLVNVGDHLRIRDGCSGDDGQIGVVTRVELQAVKLRLPCGREIRRSWGLERVK